MMKLSRVFAWVIAIGIALTATSMQASAQQMSSRAFLDAIYRPYLDKDFRGTHLDRPADVQRYFVTPLATAILKDRAAAAKRKEVPTLDGDPFIDAQDWQITNLKIAVKTSGPDKAVGVVSFTNAGTPKTMTLHLVKTGRGWRIAEIEAPSGSLRKLMKLR
jgi:hypothetical protein